MQVISRPVHMSPRFYRLESSVGRAFAFKAGGCGFKFGQHHTKGVKNDTYISFADDRIKRVDLR